MGAGKHSPRKILKQGYITEEWKATVFALNVCGSIYFYLCVHRYVYIYKDRNLWTYEYMWRQWLLTKKYLVETVDSPLVDRITLHFIFI